MFSIEDDEILRKAAVEYVSLSVTKATKQGYERCWKRWCDYLSTQTADVLDPTMSSLSSNKQILLIVNFMRHLYVSGVRGRKIQRIVSGVKQSLVFRVQDTTAFENPAVRQALISGKYSTNEIRSSCPTNVKLPQLPITFDMLQVIRERYWIDNLWNQEHSERKATYLAIMIAFDTGRRISNLTHKDGQNKEDHCIRTSHVCFNFQPCHTRKNAGVSFHQHYIEHQYTHQNVLSVEFLFLTQKQRAVQSIVMNQPIIIDRGCQESSLLIDHLVEWCLNNVNDDDDEMFTINFNGRKRLLVRRKITEALKVSAASVGVDPKRINTHSIRRGYATTISLNEKLHGNPLTRAGWTSNSTVPVTHYAVPINNIGGLSYEKKFFSHDFQKK